MGVAQVLQFSFCAQSNSATPPVWLLDLAFAAAIALGILMCLLTAIRFVKELLQVRRMTNCFHLNRYMKCLARDGMIYFIMYVLVLF